MSVIFCAQEGVTLCKLWALVGKAGIRTVSMVPQVGEIWVILPGITVPSLLLQLNLHNKY